MYPNSNEIMYRYVRTRDKELQDEANLASAGGPRPHILRRRLALIAGVALVGLAVVAILVLGLWVI